MMRAIAILAILAALILILGLSLGPRGRAFLRDRRWIGTWAAVVLAAAVWWWLAGRFGAPIDSVYEPARYEDGKIIPGRLRDTPGP